ncbi:MAG: hypothetical protein Q8941_15735 [Bacteroidota bacterium]|nr:hypothetical protein [Bacteroidota bacterium]
MSKSKTKKDKAPSPKKEMRNQITEQLKNALTGLEEKLGNKEFENRIKKAAKLLSTGIKIKPAKQSKTRPAKKESPVMEEKAE